MSFRLSVFAASATLAAILAFPAAASAADGVAVRSGTMRAGPGTDYPSVDHVESGEDLEVYGCLRGYSWCDVSNGDNRGWYQGSRIAFERGGRRVYLPDVAPEFGIGILGFGAGTYWNEHYRDRPFYDQRNRFDRNDNRPGTPNLPPPDYRPGRPNQPPPDYRPGRPNNGDNRPHTPNRPLPLEQARPPINNNPPPARANPPAQVHNNPPPVHNNPPPAAVEKVPTCMQGNCR